MKLKPQLLLVFNGQCEAAFKHYAQCFDGTISFMLTWGNSPAAGQVPPEWGAKIYHTTLTFGDAAISGADSPPAEYEPPKGFTILLQMDDTEAADRIFHALAENARSAMPLQETFWARRFGSVVDQFGIPWAINCE